ncbi:unnamed protein product [Rotaria sp. Silwood2]|nr:unnamed protein product [Rotaria sp. Silwood2]
MMVCALNLRRSNLEQKSDSGILTLANEEEMTIARLWLEHFPKLDTCLITNVGSADVTLDTQNVESSDDELPVDPMPVTQLKQHLGLERVADADPIDFMDSERKLIIVANRGSGKTAVISSLIHNVRNYYDFIWWFDCSDSLYGAMIHLAQTFHVSSVGLPLDLLQKTVLTTVLSSTKINNFLLIIDNVQEDRCTTVKAKSAIDDQERTLECHAIIDVLNNAISDPSVRHQRRRHILALYTDNSANQLPSLETTAPRANASANEWLFLPLSDIVGQTAMNWACSKLPTSLNEHKKKDRFDLIKKIQSLDTRRLTMHLTAILVSLDNLDVKEIGNELNKSNTDVLSYLVELLLKELQKLDSEPHQVAQIASLIKTNSISQAVFFRLLEILPKTSTISDLKPSPKWALMYSKLKKFNILKKNIISSMTYKHVSECYIKPEFLEIYSMPSTYARALRSSILADTNSSVWRSALELINQGFNYDYHAVEKNPDMQNIVHFFDHAHVLTMHAANWNGDEKHARLLADLLWRLGSYYLNERRLYKEASDCFRKAYEILNANENQEPSLEKATKWSAEMYRHICEQLSRKLNKEKDESSITEIENCQKNLKELTDQNGQINKELLQKYYIEADIAIARIRVEHIRINATITEEGKNILCDIIKTFNKMKEEQNMGTRTRSLMLQIFGSAHCLLGGHSKAVEYVRAALEKRKQVLPLQHLDVARTEYKLADCLFQNANTMKNDNSMTNNASNFAKILDEARSLCKKALNKQLAQLPSGHNNLEDCKALQAKLNKLETETYMITG